MRPPPRSRGSQSCRSGPPNIGRRMHHPLPPCQPYADHSENRCRMRLSAGDVAARSHQVLQTRRRGAAASAFEDVEGGLRRRDQGDGLIAPVEERLGDAAQLQPGPRAAAGSSAYSAGAPAGSRPRRATRAWKTARGRPRKTLRIGRLGREPPRAAFSTSAATSFQNTSKRSVGQRAVQAAELAVHVAQEDRARAPRRTRFRRALATRSGS